MLIDNDFYYTITYPDRVTATTKLNPSYRFDPWLYCITGGKGACWTSTALGGNRKIKKRILLSNYLIEKELLNTPINELLDNNFEVCCIDKTNQRLLKITKSSTEAEVHYFLDNLNNKISGRDEVMKEKLMQLGENPTEYLILDDMEIISKCLPEREPKVILINTNESKDSQEFLDNLKYTQRLEKIEKIKIDYDNKDVTGQILDFNQNKIPAPYLTELEIKNSPQVILPKNIKKLTIDMLQMNNINFVPLKIEDLCVIHNSSITSLDLSKFTNLTTSFN